MVSLTTVQRLLFLSAIGWAVFPRWGAAAFAASWALLFVGSRQRVSLARKIIAEQGQALTNDAEARTLLEQFPLWYLWPQVAEKWGSTWQLSALLCLLLGGVFLVWAALSQTLWFLAYLVPLTAGIFLGGGAARRLKIHERVREDLKGQKALHDSLAIRVQLKTAAGQWPPQPAPAGDLT